MNFILCGLQKSGKTFYGKRLAAQLDRQFVDTDEEIEKAYYFTKSQHLSCREIYKKEGKRYFRGLEKEQIASLLKLKKSVISLGGGSLIDRDNIQLICKLGCLIYLKASLNLVWERIQLQLPAYLEENPSQEFFYKTCEKRMIAFEKFSEYVVNVDYLNENEVLDNLKKFISSRIK